MKLTDNIVSVRHFVDDLERLYGLDQAQVDSDLQALRKAMADTIIDKVEMTEIKHHGYTEYRARLYVFTPEELESFIAYIDKTKTPTE